MTFFVTSVGKGSGADLGGLEGADAHCLSLAKAAGSVHTNWRAYLSTTAPGGEAGVNARDRIGSGPWQNAKGVVVANERASRLLLAVSLLRKYDVQFDIGHEAGINIFALEIPCQAAGMRKKAARR